MIRLPCLAALAWLVSLPARATAPTGADPVVVSVQIVAPPGTDLSGLNDLVAQAPGQPLSRAAVRRTIQLLDETGRFENVLAYTQPVGDGVVLLVQLLPRLRLTGIGFHGNVALSDDQLREKSGLRAGDEFIREHAQAAAQAVTAAYQRAGFPSAQVTWDSTLGTTQAHLEFEVEEGAPLRARRVEITGQPALDRDLLLTTLGLSEGAIVDQEALEAGVRRLAKLYRERSRFTAKIEAPRITRVDGEHADIDVPVQAGPVYHFAFRGNRSFTDKQLRAVIDYHGQELLDDAVLARLGERVLEFYRHQGFAFVSVVPKTSARAGQVEVIFEVAEDLPYRVSHLEFRGVESLEGATFCRELREAVRVVPEEPFFGFPDQAEIDAAGVSGVPTVLGRASYKPAPSVYVAEVYAQALAGLVERYREQGFLSVRVAAPVLDVDVEHRTLAITIEVAEGPQTRIQRFDFTGNEQLAPQVLADLTGLKVGDPLGKGALDRSRKALLVAIAKQGRPFARVVATQSIDDAGELGVLRYDIHEGPIVNLGRILFRGNVRTQDGFLRKNLGLTPGERYDPDALATAQIRLQQLGIFDQVQLSLLEAEVAEPVKDLLVVVHEQHPESLVLSAGYYWVEGPRLGIEYTFRNLFGEAVSLQLQLKVNYFPASILAQLQNPGSLELRGLPSAETLTGSADNLYGIGGRATAVLTDPRFVRIGETADGILRLELLGEQIDRPYYAFTRGAILPGLTFAFGRRLTVALQADLEVDRISTYDVPLNEIVSVLSVGDLQNLRFPQGLGWMGAVGPSIGYDARDNPANPRRGFAATLKGNWVAGYFYPQTQNQKFATDLILTGGVPGNGGGPLPIDLFSVSGTASGYLPVGPVVFALQLRGGRIFPFGDSFVIPTQRFFLGGPDSNRGFQLDLMLPQDYRQAIHHDIALCNQSATGASCSAAAAIVRGGNQLPSPGGDVFEELRAEARFPLYGKVLEGTLFFDAGALWSDPAMFDLFNVRPSAGLGVRLPSPVGSLAVDVGFNLTPDWAVNEQIAEPFLSIALF